MANNIHIGPWGGHGGGPWEFISNGRITKILIRSGYIVDAISFDFVDRSGYHTYRSLHFGGPNGGFHEIPFAYDEEIVKISGTAGGFENFGSLVTSLTFVTNKHTYGPYGTPNGSEFSLPVKKGKIIGFFGTSGLYLDSIGVVLCP